VETKYPQWGQLALSGSGDCPRHFSSEFDSCLACTKTQFTCNRKLKKKETKTYCDPKFLSGFLIDHFVTNLFSVFLKCYYLLALII
jgi:hypothetical protein